MGRKSKRLQANGIEAAAKQVCIVEKHYKAGIYARLSSEQDREKNASIETQIEMAERFVEKWNHNHPDKIEIIARYEDLGKTGTNFNRDGFARLMQDVRLGDINCVIVKDLSRFGRNYLEAGNYIEKIFPFLGVRFIAVSDGFDAAAEENGAREMEVEIKNLVNDMYARDFSKKAKIHLMQRRGEGSYVGGQPPYGYAAAWEGKVRKLVPDENAAEMVRFIFQRFIELQGYKAVGDELNRGRVNPPQIYKRTGEIYCPSDAVYKGWDKYAVQRILQSETYIGRLVQGKYCGSSRSEKHLVTSQEDWSIKEHAHEPLIEEEQFARAKRIGDMLRKKTEKKRALSKGLPLEENIFDKVLYCGVCGRKMTRTTHVTQYVNGDRARNYGYLCENSASTKTEVCQIPNRICKWELTGALSVLFRTECVVKLGAQKEYVEKGRVHICRAKMELERKRKLPEGAMQRLNEEESEKYMEYRTGNIPQKDYVAYKMRREEQLQEVIKRREDIQKEIGRLGKAGENYLKAIRSLLGWKSERELTKAFLETVTERIYVYPGKRVEVVFSYVDAFAEEGDPA